MVKRVLVLGATGMLGHRVVERFARECEVVGTVRGPADPWRDHPALRGARIVGGVSAEEPERIPMLLDLVRPDAVVNCVGLVKQRPDAKNAVVALTVNGLFPHRVAAAAAERGARLVHLSTDCVFSGALGRPYRESDPCDAVDLYGRSKLVGEVAGPGAVTLRTSMIGWEIVPSGGLLEWIWSQRGRRVSGYRNALFSGFTTDALADLVARVVQEHPTLEGLWHAAAPGIDKLDLLTRIDRALELGLEIVPADEPRIDRRLDGTRLHEALGWRPPSWDEMIARVAQGPRHPRAEAA